MDTQAVNEEFVICKSNITSFSELQQTTEKRTRKSANANCCSRYSPRQWTIFLAFCFLNLFAGASYSLQAPFYPELAISKGASASVYGMVFGIYELINCIASFVYGANLRKLGVKSMLHCGNVIMAICCILFGFLDKVPGGVIFTSLSFIIRIIEAVGQSAYITAAYATVAREFPEKIATTFSILETIFALGMILGPAIGGFLYEVGGYLLPFAVVGSLLLLVAFVTMYFIPKIDDPPERPKSLTKLFKVPSIVVNYYSIAAVSFSIGFTQALLQPFITQFGIRSSMIGLIFMLDGLIYAFSATLWGFLAEKGVNPKLLCTIGGVVVATSFTLIGPAPFIPINQTLWLLILSLVIHGIGAGAEYVSTFLDLSKEALLHGFPDNIETYGLVSGLWVSGLSLGSFLGPSVSGFLYDSIGFRYSALVVLIMHILVAILSFGSYQNSQLKEKKEKNSIASIIEMGKTNR